MKSVKFCAFDKGCKPKREEELVLLLYNILLPQHYHPIRHIHCQIVASEFPTDFDSWDMLTIIGSRSPILASFSCPFKLYIF